MEILNVRTLHHWFFIHFILLIFLLPLPFVFAQDDGNSCSDLKPNFYLYSKGLHTFEESQNSEGTCAPIAAGVSQHWFKTKCEVKYREDYDVQEFISRLERYFFTQENEGTLDGDIFLGLRKFLDDESLGNCFNITIISCSSNSVKYTEEQKRAFVRANEVTPFSELSTQTLSSNSPLIDIRDEFIQRCPAHEDVVNELRKSSDVLLRYVGVGISHTVAVDGIDEEGVNVNSNGLSAKLRGPFENEFDNRKAKRMYEEAGFSDQYEEDRRWFSGKEKYEAEERDDFPQGVFLRTLISVTPNEGCNIECPEVETYIGYLGTNDKSLPIPEYSIIGIVMGVVLSLAGFILIRQANSK